MNGTHVTRQQEPKSLALQSPVGAARRARSGTLEPRTRSGGRTEAVKQAAAPRLARPRGDGDRHRRRRQQRRGGHGYHSGATARRPRRHQRVRGAADAATAASEAVAVTARGCRSGASRLETVVVLSYSRTHDRRRGRTASARARLEGPARWQHGPLLIVHTHADASMQLEQEEAARAGC